MKRAKSALWGVLLIVVGLIVALNAMEITQVDVFFDGWWTMFLILPCGIGLLTEREKLGNFIGLGIGVVLLLCSQGIMEFELMWKLLFPSIILIIGLKMVYNAAFGNHGNDILGAMEDAGKSPNVGCATFSGTNMNFDGEVFEGAELTAAFGGVKCDLRNAIIEKDCAIKVSATFGGITVLVPSDVNVKVNANCMFGGVENNTPSRPGAVTLYITGSCMFGGVEIK